jgi:hypothetical protein
MIDRGLADPGILGRQSSIGHRPFLEFDGKTEIDSAGQTLLYKKM